MADVSNILTATTTPSKNKNVVVLSILFELTRRAEWDAVAQRCETHPHEVKCKEQDEDGYTILHWACRIGGGDLKEQTRSRAHPVLYVVDAILVGCPELVTIPNSEGVLPLHLACTCRLLSSGIIRTLVQAYPPSAGMIVTSWGGKAPLHLLCERQCQTDSLRALLESPEGVASTRLKDNLGDTPMMKLDGPANAYTAYCHLAELQRLKRKPRMWRGQQRQDQITSIETKSLLDLVRATGFWEKVELLALAEYTQKPLAPRGGLCFESTTTTVFHSLVKIWHFPHATITLASFLIPQALMQKDERGDLPLHVAIRGKCDRMIREILNAQPLAAAIPDGTGALPLQIYLGRSHVQSWSPLVKTLIRAFPPAVKRLDLNCRLYPLLWSRLNRLPIIRNPSAGDLNTLFLLIQSAPDAFLDAVV